MDKYLNKIEKILDEASCNESMDDYGAFLYELMDFVQSRIETADWGDE